MKKSPAKNSLDPRKRDGIISLIAILGIGMFALGTAFTVSYGAIVEAKKNHNSIRGDQSFYTAEAGMKEGIYQYINTGNEFSSSSYPEINESDINTISATTLDWPIVEVAGDAGNESTKRIVKMLLTVFPEGLAFDYATYAEDLLNFGGNVTVNGNVFANNDITFTGKSAEINGDAYSSADIQDYDNINGNSYENVSPIPPPSFDPDPYEDEAQDNGTYFTDSDDAESLINNNQVEEVVFVDDEDSKTKITGSNTELTGSIVTTGDLELSGSTITASDDHLAVFVMGDLKIAGGTTINGIVYVMGETSFGGGTNTINGSLISVGPLSFTDLTGNATINHELSYIEGWEDTEGLNTTSASDPQIIGWGEE